jgi:hypothetical protein
MSGQAVASLSKEPKVVAIPDDGYSADVRIEEEFADLIPPSSQDELAHLETSLKVEGCRDPLVVWARHNILLDGHNRYRLCSQYHIPFRVQSVALADHKAARAWVIANQMTHRNLTPDGVAYLRGQRYLAEKRGHGGEQERRPGSSGHSDHSKTSERLAKEFKVSAKTVRRDADFTRAVDVVAAVCGAKAKPLILTRDARLSHGDVLKLSKLDEEEQQRIFAEVCAAQRRIRGLWSGDGPPRQLTLPRPTEPLAAALVKKLGQAEAVTLVKLLTRILKPDGKREEGQRTERRRKPG